MGPAGNCLCPSRGHDEQIPCAARRHRRDAVRPWQPQPEGGGRVRRAGRGAARAAARRAGGIWLSRIRQPGDPPGARPAARGGGEAHSRGAGHVVCRRARQERHPVGAQHLCRGPSRARGELWAGTGGGPEAPPRSGGPDRGGNRGGAGRGAAHRDAAGGGGARGVGPRREFQCRQGGSAPVGRHGVRLGGGGLFGRDLPAGGAGAAIGG